MKFLIFSLIAFVVAAAPALAEIDFDQAVEKELITLQAQKKGIESQAQKAIVNNKARMAKLEAEYLNLQNEVVALEKQNQLKSRKLTRLREVSGSFLENEQKTLAAWQRLEKLLAEKEAFYHLNLSPVRSDLAASSRIEEPAKYELIQRMMDLLQNSFETQKILTSYLVDSELTESEVQRFGLIGAVEAQSFAPIMPSENGKPSLLFSAKKLAPEGFFIFESYSQKTAQARASLLERFAFLIPALFIGMLFLIVFGIFALFIRE
jgi:hypothetical protein